MITIVGDFTHEKSFMIVEYTKGEGNSKYVGHKVLSRYKTREEAEQELGGNQNDE